MCIIGDMQVANGDGGNENIAVVGTRLLVPSFVTNAFNSLMQRDLETLPLISILAYFLKRAG